MQKARVKKCIGLFISPTAPARKAREYSYYLHMLDSAGVISGATDVDSHRAATLKFCIRQRSAVKKIMIIIDLLIQCNAGEAIDDSDTNRSSKKVNS